MQSDAAQPAPVVWTFPSAMWLVLAACGFCLGVFFYPSLVRLWDIWMTSEEYSYGVMIPFIAAFMLWQRRDRLALLQFAPSWVGLVVLLVGLAIGALAHIATSLALSLYAFLLCLGGLAYAFLGRRGFMVVLAPLAMLILMFPLPDIIFRELSQTLQLWSSQIGVGILRLIGVSVFLDGNVIDLGTMKLQVVEACSGLRYLFSLVTLGIIAAYFYRGPLWQKLVLVASTVPITVLMNSVRIALVGVTVEHFGIQAAEGVLHDFEGLVVFAGCMVLLIAQIWLFARLSGRKLQDAFVITLDAPKPAGAQARARSVPATLGVALAVLAGAAVANTLVPLPEPVSPQRRDFTYFPQQVGEWQGKPVPLERQFADVLQLDDYLLANYMDPAGRLVNAYVAYYASQTQRLHDHSPRQCMPGGGWEIRELKRHTVPGIEFHGKPLNVNRVIIQKGEDRQLVYYWFKQRDRILDKESQVKFYMVWDTLTRQRSDGALVRLVTPVARGEPLSAGDERLTAFAAELVPRLPEHVPQ
jgi:exosortase D (VPLPA-CTERM-specific)